MFLLMRSGVGDAIISVNSELQASQCSPFPHHSLADKIEREEKALQTVQKCCFGT